MKADSTGNHVLQAIRDYKKGSVQRAVERFTSLSQEGSANAASYLGGIYEWGARGLPPDPGKALTLYKQAADQGDLLAYIGLGRLHLRGQGVEQNFKKAFYYYSLVENRGYANGPMLVTLGRMYQFGWGIEKDSNKAEYYYRLASAVGNVYGRRYLGLLLLHQGHWLAGNLHSLRAVFSSYLIAAKSPSDDRLKEM